VLSLPPGTIVLSLLSGTIVLVASPDEPRVDDDLRVVEVSSRLAPNPKHLPTDRGPEALGFVTKAAR
jgi:hypothetical protein